MRHSVYFRFYILSFQFYHSIAFKIAAETNKIFDNQSIDIRMLLVSQIWLSSWTKFRKWLPYHSYQEPFLHIPTYNRNSLSCEEVLELGDRDTLVFGLFGTFYITWFHVLSFRLYHNWLSKQKQKKNQLFENKSIDRFFFQMLLFSMIWLSS